MIKKFRLFATFSLFFFFYLLDNTRYVKGNVHKVVVVVVVIPPISGKKTLPSLGVGPPYKWSEPIFAYQCQK